MAAPPSLRILPVSGPTIRIYRVSTWPPRRSGICSSYWTHMVEGYLYSKLAKSFKAGEVAVTCG